MNSIGRFLMFAAALLLTLSSCVKEDISGENTSEREAVVIKGSNPETKTSLSGLDVLWSEGDMVGIIAVATDYDKVRVDYDYDVKAENIEGASADFVAFLMGDHKPEYMLYPGNEAIVYNHEAKEITTSISNVQTATLNTFAQGSNLSLGKIIDGEAELKNLMSVFKIEVTGNDIVELNVEARGGETLAGDVTIDLETMEIESITNGWSSIKLVPAEGQACLTPGVYCIPVPAGHYSQGIAFDFLDKEGFHARKNKTEEFDLPSGKLIDLGKQSDLGIDIHVGYCSTGDLTYLGANRFRLTGNEVKGKNFELENTVFGVEYSLDKGRTWEYFEFGTMTENTVDVEFEVVSPGKMLYRTFAKYRGDDPVRGEEKAWVPENLVFTIVWNDPDQVKEKLRYVGTDASLISGFPTITRRTDKGYSGDNGWDTYQIQVMPGYWSDWGIKYPGDYGTEGGGNNTSWYTINTTSFYMGCVNMYTILPAVRGCKLDRMLLVATSVNRRAYVSETSDKLTAVGMTSSYIGTAEITADDVASHPSLSNYYNVPDKTYYYAEWAELSTNPGEGKGATGRVTKENTPYYIHNYSNGHFVYMELEYIPVE